MSTPATVSNVYPVTTPFRQQDANYVDINQATARQDLMNAQLSTNEPQPPSGVFSIISDALIPDRTVIDRLGNFDPEIYDLRDTSNLMKIMTALLGGAGVGGLRKQTAVARLENAFATTHFLDLDRFYGALFGIVRTNAELMPDFGALTDTSGNLPQAQAVAGSTLSSTGVQFDPYTDAAGSDVWDDVHSRDASYRARLIKFARAIPQGGTYAGLLAAAEAILAVDCELYESWTWCDDLADHGGVAVSLGYTWGQMEKAFSSWGAVERQHTWGTFAGRVLMLGRTGTSNRSEVQIVPKRPLRLDEQYQLVRVLNALKPAGVSITVDANGLAVHEQTAIRAVAADSEYWEVTSRVVPASAAVTSTGTSLYEATVPGQPQPRPAFSQYTGEAWSCNNDITSVVSYEMQGESALTSSDYERVVYGDGTHHDYTPAEALIPGAHAAAARSACDGVLTSHPYCAPRGRAGRKASRR